jgi:hypothetical protein
MTMLRHIAVMLALTFAALAAGIYMVPGSREQWTMLVRDERNAEALDLLEHKYRAGERDPEEMLQLYKLLMSSARIDRATQVIRELATKWPDDVAALTMLAQHYGDTQDARNETRTLERLYAVQPSPATAQRMLVLYRLDAAAAAEQRLLAKMLANKTIAADDAQRLGFMLAAKGDLPGARQALAAFDRMAPPDNATGRLALFDVMLRLGEPKPAMALAEHWLSRGHDAGLNRGLAGRNFPLARLVQLMVNVDPDETSRIVCSIFAETPPLDPDVLTSPPICSPPRQANGAFEINTQDVEEADVAAARGSGDVRPAH